MVNKSHNFWHTVPHPNLSNSYHYSIFYTSCTDSIPHLWLSSSATSKYYYTCYGFLTPQFQNFRTSCLQMFLKIDVLKTLANFTGKHLCWPLRVCNFIKKRIQYRCFAMKFATFSRTPFLQNTSGGCFTWIFFGLGSNALNFVLEKGRNYMSIIIAMYC